MQLSPYAHTQNKVGIHLQKKGIKYAPKPKWHVKSNGMHIILVNKGMQLACQSPKQV